MTQGRITYSSRFVRAALFWVVTSLARQRHHPAPTYKNMVISCVSSTQACAISLSPFLLRQGCERPASLPL